MRTGVQLLAFFLTERNDQSLQNPTENLGRSANKSGSNKRQAAAVAAGYEDEEAGEVEDDELDHDVEAYLPEDAEYDLRLMHIAIKLVRAGGLNGVMVAFKRSSAEAGGSTMPSNNDVIAALQKARGAFLGDDDGDDDDDVAPKPNSPEGGSPAGGQKTNGEAPKHRERRQSFAAHVAVGGDEKPMQRNWSKKDIKKRERMLSRGMQDVNADTIDSGDVLTRTAGAVKHKDNWTKNRTGAASVVLRALSEDTCAAAVFVIRRVLQLTQYAPAHTCPELQKEEMQRSGGAAMEWGVGAKAMTKWARRASVKNEGHGYRGSVGLSKNSPIGARAESDIAHKGTASLHPSLLQEKVMMLKVLVFSVVQRHQGLQRVVKLLEDRPDFKRHAYQTFSLLEYVSSWITLSDHVDIPKLVASIVGCADAAKKAAVALEEEESLWEKLAEERPKGRSRLTSVVGNIAHHRDGMAGGAPTASPVAKTRSVIDKPITEHKVTLELTVSKVLWSVMQQGMREAMTNTSANGHIAKVLLARGGVGALIRIFKEADGNEDVMVYTSNTIRCLLQTETSNPLTSNRPEKSNSSFTQPRATNQVYDAMANSGLVPSVIEAMFKYLRCERFAWSAVKLVRAFGSFQRKDKALMKAVLATMEQYSNSHLIVTDACHAIDSLLAGPGGSGNAAALIAEGGIQLVTQALREHVDQHALLVPAAAALAKLAQESPQAAKISHDTGATHALLYALKHSEKGSTRAHEQLNIEAIWYFCEVGCLCVSLTSGAGSAAVSAVSGATSMSKVADDFGTLEAKSYASSVPPLSPLVPTARSVLREHEKRKLGDGNARGATNVRMANALATKQTALEQQEQTRNMEVTIAILTCVIDMMRANPKSAKIQMFSSVVLSHLSAESVLIPPMVRQRGVSTLLAAHAMLDKHAAHGMEVGGGDTAQRQLALAHQEKLSQGKANITIHQAQRFAVVGNNCQSMTIDENLPMAIDENLPIADHSPVLHLTPPSVNNTGISNHRLMKRRSTFLKIKDMLSRKSSAQAALLHRLEQRELGTKNEHPHLPYNSKNQPSTVIISRALGGLLVDRHCIEYLEEAECKVMTCTLMFATLQRLSIAYESGRVLPLRIVAVANFATFVHA
jgi:hypothetical protein